MATLAKSLILRQLKALQDERRQREHHEIQEAVKIYRAHRIAGEPFDPQAIGFVLSIPQIELYIHRQHLADAQFIAEEAARNRRKAHKGFVARKIGRTKGKQVA